MDKSRIIYGRRGRVIERRFGKWEINRFLGAIKTGIKEI
jgi:hypothetical protein